MGLSGFFAKITASKSTSHSRLADHQSNGDNRPYNSYTSQSRVSRQPFHYSEEQLARRKSRGVLDQPNVFPEERPLQSRSQGPVHAQEQNGHDEKQQAKRKSHGLTTSKSEAQLTKRKSWFGNRALEVNAPAVPPLPVKGYERNSHYQNPARPQTANVTVDSSAWNRPETATDNKEKRKSFFSRARSQSSAAPGKSKGRQSWFGGRADDEDAPPLPPLPAPARQQADARRSVAPPLKDNEENRRSKRFSLSRALSRSRTKSHASLSANTRNSWERESRPPMPPMPALVQDDSEDTSADSSVTTTRSLYQHRSQLIEPDIFADPPAMRTATRGGELRQPRPVSMSSTHRNSYVPKRAAESFLKSTSGPDRRKSQNRADLLMLGENRASYRKSSTASQQSLNDGARGGGMYLNEEQQKEWEKLKNLMEVMERRQDNGVVAMLRELDEDDDEERQHQYGQGDGYGRQHGHSRGKYSNADALSALEYGHAR